MVILQVKNRSKRDSYRVTGSLFVESIHYTGRNRDRIKSTEFAQNIPPESVELIEMEVTFYDYFKKLVDQADFSISCIAKVHETDYDYYAQDDFRVRKPDVKIKLQGIPEVDQEIDVILRLANPLPIPLKNCLFHVQGTGLERQLPFKVIQIAIQIIFNFQRTNNFEFEKIIFFHAHSTDSRGARRWNCISHIQIRSTLFWPGYICRKIFLQTAQRRRWIHSI